MLSTSLFARKWSLTKSTGIAECPSSLPNSLLLGMVLCTLEMESVHVFPCKSDYEPSLQLARSLSHRKDKAKTYSQLFRTAQGRSRFQLGFLHHLIRTQICVLISPRQSARTGCGFSLRKRYSSHSRTISAVYELFCLRTEQRSGRDTF